MPVGVRDVTRGRLIVTGPSLRYNYPMNWLEGGKGGEGRMGERGWGGDG